MKNLIYSILGILFLSVISCSKSDDPATLELTVLDNLGNRVVGATVLLYTSQQDYDLNQNFTGFTTNTEGELTVKELNGDKYFWRINKGCLSNQFSTITTSGTLNLGVVNKVNCIVGPTATIYLKNNSTDPYKVYINGVVALEVNGKAIIPLLIAAQITTIRVLQLSGYVLYPIDKNYISNLSCDQTETIEFP
ncbi:MAG: hypothetical protein ABI851_02730 [Saprospiraceae bacterium]